MLQLNIRKDLTHKASLEHLNNDDIIASIKAGFFSLDKKLKELDAFKLEEDKSGSTVVAALVTFAYIGRKIYISTIYILSNCSLFH